MTTTRVVLVSGNAPPTIDGVGDYTGCLLQHLKAERPSWSWFWLSRRRRWFSPPIRRSDGVTILQPGHTWSRRDKALVRSTLAFLRPHLVHIQDQIHSFHETDAAVKIAMAAPCPVVTTLHEFHTELPSVRHTVELVHASDRVIASDRRCASRCHAMASRESDDVWWSPSNVPPASPDWNVKPVPGRVTTFGQINHIKSFHTVRDALQQMRRRVSNLHWHIVGPFLPASNALHAQLASDLAADWITFTGGAPTLADCAFRSTLAQSECMVLPYRDGASPRRTTLQTAWAFGIPVVTTAPELAEPAIVDGMNCILVHYDSVDAWTAGLERVLLNGETRSQLRQGAYETAERFSWSRLTRKHVELYDSILGG